MQEWVAAGNSEAGCIRAQEKDMVRDSGTVPVISLGDLQAHSSWPQFPWSINVKLKSSLTQGCREDKRVARVPRERCMVVRVHICAHV